MSMLNPQLVSHHLCPYVQRAVITLLEKEIPHQRIYIDLSDKPDWFQLISPLGKVPLLRIENEVLFESAVICEYLDEITPNSLHPSNPLQKAKHRSWIEFGSSILNTIAGFYNAPNQAIFDSKRDELIQKFMWIEQNLGDKPYFSGQEFSLVDATYGPIFRYFDVFEKVANISIFSNMPKVQAWRQNLQGRPSIQQAVTGDYPERLLAFLKRRNSYLSMMIS